MRSGLTERVRNLVVDKYILPAKHSGSEEFAVSVRDVLNDLALVGDFKGHTPQVCGALKSAKFARAHGLEIAQVTGPPSKVSPTVVVVYRVCSLPPVTGGKEDAETPQARAFRVTEGLRGLLKEEFAAYGGGEAFLRRMRSDEDEGNAEDA